MSWLHTGRLNMKEYLTGMKYRRSLEVVYTEGLQDDCATFIFQKGIVSTHNAIFTIDGTETEMLDLPEEVNFPNENSLDFEFHAVESGSYSLELAYVSTPRLVRTIF